MKNLLPSQFNTNTKNLIFIFSLFTLGLGAATNTIQTTPQINNNTSSTIELNNIDSYYTFYSIKKIAVLEGGNTGL